MASRLLKPRPRPNLGIATRRKALNIQSENKLNGMPELIPSADNTSAVNSLVGENSLVASKLQIMDSLLASETITFNSSMHDDCAQAAVKDNLMATTCDSAQSNNNEHKNGNMEAFSSQQQTNLIENNSVKSVERKLKTRPKPNISLSRTRRPVQARLQDKIEVAVVQCKSATVENSVNCSAPSNTCSKLLDISDCSASTNRNTKKTKIEEGKLLQLFEVPKFTLDLESKENKKKNCCNPVKSLAVSGNSSKTEVVHAEIAEKKVENMEPSKDDDHKKHADAIVLENFNEKSEITFSGKRNGPNKTSGCEQNFRMKVCPRMSNQVTGVKALRVKIRYDDDNKCKKVLDPEVIRKREEKLNNLIGEPTNDVPNDGVRVTFQLDSSDESNISESAKITDSPNSRYNSLTNSSIRNSRLNNVKPNLTIASNRMFSFNHSSYGQMSYDTKKKFRLLFGNRSPERSKMTMKDLIFYNPRKNAITGNDGKKDERALLPESKTTVQEDSSEISNASTENVTSNEEAASGNDSDLESISSIETKAVDKNGLPVPQLKLSADGKVIIAPESLIVKGKNDTSKKESRPLIVEDDLTHHKVGRLKPVAGLKKNWTFQETLKFYRVLHETGSDFSTMAYEFPDRTRKCLKRKFKKEEKINGDLIDRVLPGFAKLPSDEALKSVEEDLAVKRMVHEFERYCRRKSGVLPDIPDISKGITADMFLARRERQETKKKSVNCAVEISETSTAENLIEPQSNDRKTKEKVKAKRIRTRPKRINLQYFYKEKPRPPPEPTIDDLLKAFYKSDNVETNTNNNSSDDEVEINHKPIVVNTSIESSGIKYTKSITLNPSNLDNPVDINETISHDNGQQFPNSSDIIDEIVNILSSDGQSVGVNNLKDVS